MTVDQYIGWAIHLHVLIIFINKQHLPSLHAFLMTEKNTIQDIYALQTTLFYNQHHFLFMMKHILYYWSFINLNLKWYFCCQTNCYYVFTGSRNHRCSWNCQSLPVRYHQNQQRPQTQVTDCLEKWLTTHYN